MQVSDICCCSKAKPPRRYTLIALSCFNPRVPAGAWIEFLNYSLSIFPPTCINRCISAFGIRAAALLRAGCSGSFRSAAGAAAAVSGACVEEEDAADGSPVSAADGSTGGGAGAAATISGAGISARSCAARTGNGCVSSCEEGDSHAIHAQTAAAAIGGTSQPAHLRIRARRCAAIRASSAGRLRDHPLPRVHLLHPSATRAPRELIFVSPCVPCPSPCLLSAQIHLIILHSIGRIQEVPDKMKSQND